MSNVSMVNGHDDAVVQGDLINRSALLENVWDADTMCGYVQVVDRADIEKAPAVDAVPVVRCKDCGCYMSESGKYVEHCCLTGLPVDAGDFCSYGKRRDGE